MIAKTLLDQLSTITEEEQHILDGQDSIERDLYMTGNANIINSKKLLEEGRQITIRKHTRFIGFPEHTHDYVEIVYMCKGSTTHLINGEQVVLQEGDLLFLAQGAVQEILPAGEDDIAVNFIVMPTFFDTTLKAIGNEETPLKTFLVDCLNSHDTPTTYLYFHAADILPVQNLVENLLYTLIQNPQNRRNLNQTTMALLFLNLMNYTDHLEFQREEDTTAVQILQYIEEHYNDGSLAELASSLHYDPSWLSREIKSYTGKTYTELVQEKRMVQASFLLTNTDLNVDEIAYQVGYDNISYFHRLFRKKYDLSPKKYRTANRLTAETEN